ncbi:alpha-2-macroglobulin family protein [Mucilaginibacter sp. FT3.2]|uniref:alpha-2-macroglobulin family protein n=1 Tax=Mucilaginibacter sp. FT3.2 TaxID=2723090 RepID=UPI001610F8E1|nr:alpha-2-macroglobulin family protein [Mucilaginibacter sp. FT3.2]MBB6231542.1 uncharacterized protein YfaS (alpha-2-macroglobulin family) [Mucilaginibacter sp. FT3.2]
MPSHTCKTLKLLLIGCLLLIIKPASAQTSYHNIIFKIDSLIDVGLPKSALKEVDQLDALAHKENNTPQMIRAVIYHIKFQTYLQEDALVSVINTLKADIARSPFPVKPVLQSFLADMYWKYYQQNRYQFLGRSKLEVVNVDFRKWDLATIINETTRQYTLSLKDAEKEQNTSLDILDGILTGDKNTRFLRPTLYDLLLQRAFNYFLDEEPALNKPKMPFSVNDDRFFSDSKTFANLNINTTDTSSTLYQGIRLLQQGIAFHLQKNDHKALADLDMKRLTFVHNKAVSKNKDSIYIVALKHIATDTTAGIISADALLAIGKYYSSVDSLTTAMVYLQKTITNYPKSPGAQGAGNQINQITQQILTINVEDVNAPGIPILANLNYRNIQQVRYRVYNLTGLQANKIAILQQNEASGYAAKTLAFIKELQPLQDKNLNLPVTTDLKEHNTEFKIDALGTGTYLLMATETGIKDNITQLTTFKVSALAYLIRTRPDRKREIQVTNRETGNPISAASVTIAYQPFDYGRTKRKPIVITGTTDVTGTFIFNNQGSNYSLSIGYQGDRLVNDNQYESYSSQPILNDDPVTKTIFFTDRQIYRPGQTIYFKALQLQVINGKSSIMPHTDIDVELHDQNAKQLATVKLKTNEFGTVTFPFIIPQNVLNGWLNIITKNGRIDVKVEEYKRPTFKVEFAPFSKNYKLNDSVVVKGKVNAFSGYGLSGARVACHITRTTVIKIRDDYSRFKPQRYNYKGSPFTEIAVDTVKADEQGNFEIKFLAAGVDKSDLNEAFRFNVNADVTDGSNETQNANTSISISNNAVELETNVPESIIAKNGVDAAVNIFSTNHQKLNGKANIKIFALKGSATFFKTRLWDIPDKWMMSKSEYAQYFPGFAYDHEDEYPNWKRQEKIAELDINLDKNSDNKINLDKLLKSPGGIYALVINAKNDNGDTASVTKYINLIANEAPVQKVANWVVSASTTVKPNEAAEFYVGIGKNCNVLLETFDGPKLLSSQNVALNASTPKKISIPVLPSVNNAFSVQFTLIKGNRQYLYYQRIIVQNTVKPLNIRFLTMRNKLQPGEKEKWKLQIEGNNNKQTSELLAGLYDASLDDIIPAVRWQTELTNVPFMASYFQWESTAPSSNISTNGNTPIQPYYDDNQRTYEDINMLGFYYFGDDGTYRDYLDAVKPANKKALSNAQIEAWYTKNASLIKTGFDVVGRVVWRGNSLPGISVKINNSKISVITNSLGYFRIKIPYNTALLFSSKDYVTKKITPTKGVRLIVNMKSLTDQQRELQVADPGAKSQKGDPNANIRIDEPVGNSDVKQVVEADANYMFNSSSKQYGLQTIGYAKKLNADIVTLREIQTTPSQKFNKELLLRSAREINTPVTIRTNFNETAFFYPQLHTDDKGQIVIDFTIPEALTRWKFRGFVHNKDLQSGYVEQEVITQKKMMISANMPRFLREGDTLSVSARVVNLSAQHLKGNARLEFFNAVTLQPVNLFAKAKEAEHTFELDSSSTGSVSYKLIVPAGLEALTYRLTASAGNYTDGEENTLPVLPNSMLVTETMPMMVRPGQTKTFSFDKLINQGSNTLNSKTLTLEYTQNPAWTAIQSLPYLMEFPYECSEQTFSRYYANSLATNILNHYPKIKQVFEQWKNTDSKALISNLEKDTELKSILLEETPWLQDALTETEQKKRIALLFDLNKMTYELDANLSKLQKKQLSNGGFPWFVGDFADRYITQHVLAGIGQLFKANITNENNTKLKEIKLNALRYLDNELKADENRAKKQDKKYLLRNLNDIEIHAWYARSYFTDNKPDAELNLVQTNYIKRATTQWLSRTEFEKAMIGLTLYRWGEKETAAAIIKSLLETAQQSDELGMYWAANRSGYYWYQAPIETQSLMIELFTEAGNNPKAVEEMKIWLLCNKQTNNWRTTKATAAACYALLMKGINLVNDTSKININLNGKPLTDLKPGVKTEAGTGNIKTTWVDEQIKPSLGNVQIRNSSKSINWGAMYWQYTEKLDKITSSNTNVQLVRKYFIQKQTDAGPVLIAIDATHFPKTGDILKVVIYLKTDRDLDYIQLKDLRPAGTEPMDALSAYKYQDGLYYYQVSKDVATNFFITALPKGNYIFEYMLRVVQPGNYATGITSLQSMYAPEFNAHTEGGRIILKP